MKYYVVVTNGSLQDIYNDWTTCAEKIKHLKKVKFKKFENRLDALEFVFENSKTFEEDITLLKSMHPDWGCAITTFKNKDRSIAFVSEKEKMLNSNICYIFTDGSYNENIKNYSYGFCVVYNNKIVYKESNKGTDSEAAKMHQVAGEIEGALHGVEYAIKQKYKSVTIVYDYQGVESWARKSWKAKNKYTQEYSEEMSAYAKKIDIDFLKVKSHLAAKNRNQFNEFNEVADKLAKSALKK